MYNRLSRRRKKWARKFGYIKMRHPKSEWAVMSADFTPSTQYPSVGLQYGDYFWNGAYVVDGGDR